MKKLFYECFAGLSGDMNLGALLDLGVSLDRLKQRLSLLGLDNEFRLNSYKDHKHAIYGTKCQVIDLNQAENSHSYSDKHTHQHSHSHHHSHHLPEHSARHAEHSEQHHHTTHSPHGDQLAQDGPGQKNTHSHHHARNYSDITALINNSTLSDRVKRDSLAIFKIIGQAEAKIHNKSLDDVHFHEVGAIDSIVDIVGTAIAMELLDVDQIIFQQLEVGSGFVRCAHGMMPIPAPATAEILKGIAYTQQVNGYEMTTPTGAAILKYYGVPASAAPPFVTSAIGYGLGSRDLNIPNVVRASLVEIADNQSEKQYIIESNLDDITAENLTFASEMLRSAGAREVFLTPITMKKGRSAVKLTILCDYAQRELMMDTLYTHTSAIGARAYQVDKFALKRKLKSVDTPYGAIDVKVSYYRAKIHHVKAEYEQCAAAAKAHSVALSEVQRAALQSFHQLVKKDKS